MSVSRISVPRLIAEEIATLPAAQRAIILAWSRDAQAIRKDSSLSDLEKLKRMERRRLGPAVDPFLLALGGRLKQLVWNDRSWAQRLALVGIALGVTVAGTQAAGAAIGVKVYLLTAAGGALLGALVQELERSLVKKS